MRNRSDLNPTYAARRHAQVACFDPHRAIRPGAWLAGANPVRQNIERTTP